MISHSTKVLARQALSAQLHSIEYDICCDKAMVAKYFDLSDVLLPYETAEHFSHLNFWKTELRNDRNRAARIRKSLKELK